MSNYSVGHESSAGHVEVPDYPDQHIEVGSPLAMEMGALLEKYPDALWIHLIRDREACVRSIAANCPVQVEMFGQVWRHLFQRDLVALSRTYYDLVNANIRRMLPSSGLTFPLEGLSGLWPSFWERIRAAGDLRKSVEIIRRRYNATGKRGRDNFLLEEWQ
jgi:hypothetical protein